LIIDDYNIFSYLEKTIILDTEEKKSKKKNREKKQKRNMAQSLF
jgi:hypothetical protein